MRVGQATIECSAEIECDATKARAGQGAYYFVAVDSPPKAYSSPRGPSPHAVLKSTLPWALCSIGACFFPAAPALAVPDW